MEENAGSDGSYWCCWMDVCECLGALFEAMG
jgi:hypothetical protein